MVRFTVLASGSKGNCTVLSGGRTRILVDAGLSCRELFRRMKLAGEEPTTLNAIVITHEHQDHVNGLAVTARKLGIPVYFTEATHRAWMRWMSPRRQMSYAQWLEMIRKQAAERQAEPEAGDRKRSREPMRIDDGCGKLDPNCRSRIGLGAADFRTRLATQLPIRFRSLRWPPAHAQGRSHLASRRRILPAGPALLDRRHLP